MDQNKQAIEEGKDFQVSRLALKVDAGSSEPMFDPAVQVLEYHVPPGRPHPGVSEDREYREEFIRDKYEKRVFSEALAPKDRLTDTVAMRACARRRESIFGTMGGTHVKPPTLARLASGSGMVEYVGMLKIRVLSASGFGSIEALCEARLGLQRLKTSPGKSRGTSRSKNLVWDQVLMLCWDGQDVLELAVLNARGRGASLGTCRINLNGLPPRSQTTLLTNLHEKPPEGVTLPWVACNAAKPNRRSLRISLVSKVTSLVSAHPARGGESVSFARNDSARETPQQPPRARAATRVRSMCRSLCGCVGPAVPLGSTKLRVEIFYEPIEH